MKPGLEARADARVLVVDDDDAFRTGLARELEASGYQVRQANGGSAAVAAVGEEEPDVVLLDLALGPGDDGLEVLARLKAAARPEVVVLTGHGTVRSAIQAMKAGAADYLLKPCDLDELELAVDRALQTRRLKERAAALERGLSAGHAEMVGVSARFRALLEEVAQAARSRMNVLVTGESGTGKELVARQLHRLSASRDRPYVVVDCAALSDELMHNELFGHERGAFTGAVDRKPGLFEVADGGTLCLDEIGEVPPRVQARLLRVLDGGTFRRMGGTREIRVDVRVVSATNRRLEESVRAGAFREDLFYRIAPLIIRVPPLRERREDVLALAEHFLARACKGRCDPPALTDAALAALAAHHWPGNVRELIGVVERLAFRGRATVDQPEVAEAIGARAAAPAKDADLTLDELERRHIAQVIERCRDRRADAARILGLSERTLYRKLKALRLDPAGR